MKVTGTLPEITDIAYFAPWAEGPFFLKRCANAMSSKKKATMACCFLVRREHKHAPHQQQLHMGHTKNCTQKIFFSIKTLGLSRWGAIGNTTE
jgi:hypothetical protein